MDVWIVAAAAGAGYVAQRLKNLTRGKNNWPNLSLANLNPESPRTIQKVQESFGEDICSQVCNDASSAEMASTSGFECENHEILDNLTVSNTNSLAGILNNEDIPGNFEGRVSESDEVICGDSLPQEFSPREIGFCYGVRKSRSSLRSRRINSKFLKPQTSLESCLMAQLYKEHAEIEEYTYSVDQTQKPIERPLLVTDGSRVISRASHQSPCSKPAGNKSALGIPRLPSLVPVELLRKAKAKAKAITGMEKVVGRSNASKMVNGTQNNAQGSPDGAHLFYLGLTMGMIYSFLGHKWEIEKLRKLLKQTENLVQDLQEELEMKDALTVKELAVEDHESLDMHNDSYPDDGVQALSLEQKSESPSKHCGQNADEESLRKIEAELEAELDRLESNMNSSRLEGKLSNLAEIDTGFVSDVIKGELRADLFGAKSGNYTDKDESGNSTPRSVHYPISPRELSLRLHEVIQSRLEERVKELEVALQLSQRKIKSMESDNTHSWRHFTNHKMDLSSTHESPVSIDGLQSTDEPIVINLSGEALAAYNDAYEEFTKLSESDEEESNHQKIFDPHKQVLDLVQNGGLNGCMNKDESEVSEDEMERLLIRQIVEKARQGSPAVLRAQKALLSNDEN